MLGVDYRSALQAAQAVAEVKAAKGDLAGLDPDDFIGRASAERRAALLGIPIVFDLPAVLIVAFVTWLLVIGIKESSRFNSAMVLLKLAVIALFVFVGAFYVRPENWHPFAPHGFAGISSAAAIIFFAYIGFDAISTAAEETQEPQRNLPIGIIASLVVCTVIYIAVAVVMTGMVKSEQFQNVADPLAKAFSDRVLELDGRFYFLWGGFCHHIGAAGVSARPAPHSFLHGAGWFVAALGQPPSTQGATADAVTTILTGVAVAAFASVSNINEVVEL
ncbi:MAG: amino acid permease [Verrucomicrobiota bacterium]